MQGAGINKRPDKRQRLPKTSYISNEMIRFKRFQLFDETGVDIGILTRDEALEIAREKKLDLVLVSADRREGSDSYPVVKIMDLGRHKYNQKKREKEIKKKTVSNDLHEVRLTPVIADNDLLIKVKKARDFLSKGNRVKITLRFRGRELTKKELGLAVFDRFLKEVEDISRTVKEAVFLTPKIATMVIERDKKKYEEYLRSNKGDSKSENKDESNTKITGESEAESQ